MTEKVEEKVVFADARLSICKTVTRRNNELEVIFRAKYCAEEIVDINLLAEEETIAKIAEEKGAIAVRSAGHLADKLLKILKNIKKYNIHVSPETLAEIFSKLDGELVLTKSGPETYIYYRQNMPYIVLYDIDYETASSLIKKIEDRRNIEEILEKEGVSWNWYGSDDDDP